MQLLEDAGIKLSSVATDISGVSGRLMLEALIGGQRDPAELAELAKRRLRSKIPELTEALTGRFGEHHGFLARVLLDLIDQHTHAIDELMARIEVNPAATSTPASTLTRPRTELSTLRKMGYLVTLNPQPEAG